MRKMYVVYEYDGGIDNELAGCLVGLLPLIGIAMAAAYVFMLILPLAGALAIFCVSCWVIIKLFESKGCLSLSLVIVISPLLGYYFFYGLQDLSGAILVNHSSNLPFTPSPVEFKRFISGYKWSDSSQVFHSDLAKCKYRASPISESYSYSAGSCKEILPDGSAIKCRISEISFSKDTHSNTGINLNPKEKTCSQSPWPAVNKSPL